MRYDDTTERGSAMDRLIDEAVAKDVNENGEPQSDVD
jgi:hypothetical protein